MQESAFTLETPIAEIMEKWPQTIQVFLDHHMICVGCQMSTFDTLADAIVNYGISAEDFINELHEAISAEDEGSN